MHHCIIGNCERQALHCESWEKDTAAQEELGQALAAQPALGFHSFSGVQGQQKRKSLDFLMLIL